MAKWGTNGASQLSSLQITYVFATVVIGKKTTLVRGRCSHCASVPWTSSSSSSELIHPQRAICCVRLEDRIETKAAASYRHRRKQTPPRAVHFFPPLSGVSSANPNKLVLYSQFQKKSYKVSICPRKIFRQPTKMGGKRNRQGLQRPCSRP